MVLPPGLTARRYIDESLEPYVLPMSRRIGPNFIFMQDNAPSHSARITQAYIREHHLEILPHPSNSPDLNPIEHVWDMMGRRLRSRQRQPSNLEELGLALNEIWHEIPQDMIRVCINMPARLAEVIRRRGGNTRY